MKKKTYTMIPEMLMLIFFVSFVTISESSVLPPILEDQNCTTQTLNSDQVLFHLNQALITEFMKEKGYSVQEISSVISSIDFEEMNNIVRQIDNTILGAKRPVKVPPPEKEVEVREVPVTTSSSSSSDDGAAAAAVIFIVIIIFVILIAAAGSAGA